MSTNSVIPPKVLQQIREDHGKDPSKWPEELRDIFDTSIVARPLSAPLSGRIKIRKNTNFHYHYAKDVCGSTPNHERVEELRAIGWDYATTEDVEMFNDFSVKNRNKSGFSNEIRNGDMRLMKCPMTLWRQKRKAENVSAYQMAYPQAFGTTGMAMRAEDLAPGLKTEMVTGQELNDFESHFRPDNTSRNPKPFTKES